MTLSLLQQQARVGIITLVSGVLAAACIVSGMVAVDFNDEAFSNPVLILSIPNVNVQAARWSMLFDMLGYYMLLIPVIYLFHDWMKNKTAWANVISFCGLAYALIGSIGASILAIIYPAVLKEYVTASPETQLILKSQFQLFNDMVYGGLWNLLEIFFAAIWWGSVGIALFRNKYSFIGVLSAVTGISCLADGISGMLEIPALHEIALNAYLLLSVIWAVIVGVFLMQKKLH
ncbi:MAG TPA: hypothetical protein VK166_01250 [Chitinophagaceae bacterium]|nr:hypothetical protein [Chitinophagaceae bacterium]